jgi:phosphoribosyl 1,2-cyclic phosphodiesterase
MYGLRDRQAHPYTPMHMHVRTRTRADAMGLCQGDKPHASHLCVTQALAWIDRLQPARALLTGFAHAILHADAEAKVRAHRRPIA